MGLLRQNIWMENSITAIAIMDDGKAQWHKDVPSKRLLDD